MTKTKRPAATVAGIEAQITEAKAARAAYLEEHAATFAGERKLAERVHALVAQLGALHAAGTNG